MLRLIQIVIAIVLAGCASSRDAPSVSQEEDELRTTYGDLSTTLEEADVDRWMAVNQALRAGFDRICGDTFCEGDYANLSHIQLNCSSTAKAHKLKGCTWVFGASLEYVDPATGHITNDARVFTCNIPVAGNASSMLDALSAAGERALETPLPATGKSFYDALGDCFSGVVAGPPPAMDTGPHAELGESRDVSWWEMKHRLVARFEQVCGDTFCEGDFANITALGFACSHDQDTDDVAECTWTFGGSNIDIGAKGKLEATTMTKTCSIPIGAKAAALESALAVDDPLQAPLPGRDTSIYDALIDCL
jgi:hypothetical protein